MIFKFWIKNEFWSYLSCKAIYVFSWGSHVKIINVSIILSLLLLYVVMYYWLIDFFIFAVSTFTKTTLLLNNWSASHTYPCIEIHIWIHKTVCTSWRLSSKQQSAIFCFIMFIGFVRNWKMDISDNQEPVRLKHNWFRWLKINLL